jgi:hypothetical protein
MSAQARAHKGYAGLRAEYLDGAGKLHRDDVFNLYDHVQHRVCAGRCTTRQFSVLLAKTVQNCLDEGHQVCRPAGHAPDRFAAATDG